MTSPKNPLLKCFIKCSLQIVIKKIYFKHQGEYFSCMTSPKTPIYKMRLISHYVAHFCISPFIDGSFSGVFQFICIKFPGIKSPGWHQYTTVYIYHKGLHSLQQKSHIKMFQFILKKCHKNKYFKPQGEYYSFMTSPKNPL